MQIYVKAMLGALNGKAIVLDLDSSDTISTIKRKIQYKEFVAPVIQRLIFCGKPLDDERTLEDYGIKEGCVIHLIVRPRVRRVILARVMYHGHNQFFV
mmetsp:Transcript_4632/g.14098  ORF Transcript_4632/g.14098 Transcript_4632/m.14098 type:complete len:98 (+) Transcript_4632:315-608(+)|eukprot:CAMPEP_0113698864 /NCGR_PEP_ID=MMETSP0038_2-20120614/22962_1 /TAXON_ID=2898 /ORGANISM="Cryptomonas paramecium" /LENGTH=97 /DNA_ID=CAMNT_0000622105 /DNA_START=300 /DNA_END=593 /DNA_ORIENTATION=+ /assembly_acc=CAM_ASM_000170